MFSREVVLKFWFVECNPQQWFKKDSVFDNNLKERFSKLVEESLIGKFDHWSVSKRGCLALILLLDQFTRNIFRDTPRAFSGDEKALQLSFQCLSKNYLCNDNFQETKFMLIPMMHSEDISVQDLSLPLFKDLNDNRTYEYALRHRDIIKRFGRFPHRNHILGRDSTEKEIEFLKNPGSSF